MEAFSAGHLEADARLRLSGYELADMEVLVLIDHLLQEPDWQAEGGGVTDEGLGKLLDFYGFESLPEVCN